MLEALPGVQGSLLEANDPGVEHPGGRDERRKVATNAEIGRGKQRGWTGSARVVT